MILTGKQVAVRYFNFFFLIFNFYFLYIQNIVFASDRERRVEGQKTEKYQNEINKPIFFSHSHIYINIIYISICVIIFNKSFYFKFIFFSIIRKAYCNIYSNHTFLRRNSNISPTKKKEQQKLIPKT